MAQLVARLLWEQEVAGSSPVSPTVSSGSSSVGRALAFQVNGRGFEPRLPLFNVVLIITNAQRIRRNDKEKTAFAIFEIHFNCISL